VIALAAVAELFSAEAERHRAEAEYHREQGQRHRQLADRYDLLASQPPTAPESILSQFWTLPADTRLSAQQVAEACGKSEAWVYKHIDARRTDVPIPYRREGSGRRHRLVFLAGEVRSWVKQREIVVRRGIVGIDEARSRRPGG
jgi:predicted DNA-binding transcriptional regulator AlpA